MMISFRCPHCGNTLHESHRSAGKLRQCPKCFQAIKVPTVQPKKSYGYAVKLIALVLAAVAAVGYACWVLFLKSQS